MSASVTSTERDEPLAVEHEGGVTRLRLNRPGAGNALDAALRDALIAALRRADADPEVRAVLLTAAGDSFCTGADLSDAPTPDGPASRRQILRPYQELFRTAWEMETPVVSAVHGRVAGTGWTLALLADLVVAGEGVKWTHAFSRLALAPHAGDPVLLPRILPFHVLNEIALLGDSVTSEVLHRWGAVNRLVPVDDVERVAAGLAARVADGPTLTLGRTRALYRRALVPDMDAGLVAETEATVVLAGTRDTAEAMTALAERRRPSFTGH